MKFKKIKTPIIYLACIFTIALLNSCDKKKEEKSIDVFAAEWSEILTKAKGQKVLFNAYGGSQEYNAYIQWAASEVKKRFDIELTHVLVKDGQEAVRKIQQEKAAKVDTGGSVDLIWINGNAFKTMHEEDLFLGEILPIIPNSELLSKNEILYEDFTIPTLGREVPWGRAQLSFYRRDTVDAFNSYNELLDILKRHPKKFTYPSADNDFTGLTFVKALVFVYADPEDRAALYKEFTEDYRITLENNPAWDLLEQIKPYLWREGKVYPKGSADLTALFKNGEIDYGMNFNPYFALSKKIQGEFSENVSSFIPSEGTISNAHFLTIPYNSGSKEASLVVINFLISPEAQARKANINSVGDPFVLDESLLSDKERDLFKNEYIADSAYPPKGIGRDTIAEFHGSIEKVIRDIWKKKFIK